ncbi:hypothetical protein ACQKND_16365 [Viridibacillus arvi]|uniref:hypothetical protein n=1 Tax=Viridibacillus arvi TaxID=263475 RepID=UPI003D043C80
MKKSLVISNFMLKMWKKEILKILDTKTKLFIAIIVAISILSISIFAGYQITSVSLKSFLNGDTRSIVLLTVSMYLNASILTIVFFIVFKAVTSDQDRLSIQLSWFPINSYEKNLGYFILFSSVILSLVFIIISIIMVPAFITQGVGVAFSLAFLLGLFLQITFVLFLMQLIYNSLNYLVKVCKIPFTKLLTLFLVILLCLTYGLETLSIKGMLKTFTVFDYNITYFLSPVFLGMIGELKYMKVNVLLTLGGYIGTVILSYFSLFLINVRSENRSLKLLHFIPIPRNKLGALTIKEIKSQCRNEENLLNFLLIVMLVLLFNFKFTLNNDLLILIILAGMTGIVALNSFGNDKKMNIAYKLYGIMPSKIVISKFMGLCILAIVQLIFFCLLLLYVPEINNSLQIILITVNSVAVFYLAGIIVPLDKNNPYTGILAFIFLLSCLVPILFIGNYVIGQIGEIMRICIIVASDLLLGIVIILINRWRYNIE